MAEATVGTLRADLILDTARFETGAKKASTSVAGLTAQAERMVKAFSGNKLTEQANNLVAAVQKIGGASRLTVAEQGRVNRTVTEAVEKYRALGQRAPAALLDLANATKGASGPTQFLTAKMVALAAAVGAFVSQLALQAVRALVNFARQSFSAASNIVDLANKTGLSTEAIQRMQFVANQTGSSLESMTQAAFTLGVRLDGNSTTVRDALEELRKYGLEWDRFRNAPIEDKLVAINAALGNIRDTEERNRLGVALYSRTFSTMAAAVAEGYDKIASQAQVATDAQIRELDRLNDEWVKTWDNIRTRVGAALGATFEELRVRKEVSADIAAGLIQPWQDAEEIARRLRVLASAARDIPLPTEQAAQATESYRLQLAKVRAELAVLTPAQRAEIAAAMELGISTDILEDQYGLTAGALRILNSQTKEYATNLNTTADAAKKAAEAQRAFVNFLGEREIEDAARAMADLDAAERSHRQLVNQLGEQEIADHAAGLDRQAADERAFRAFQNQVGEQFIKDEEARIERREALVAQFFGAVDGFTRQITDSFGEMLTGLRSFKDAFLDIWKSIRRAVANVLSGMLQDFIGGYLRKVVASAAGTALAGAGAGAALGGGAAAAGAGAGAGAGGGSALAALATNPWTLGLAAAGALLTWGITKKGWFRGGAEASINPRRDRFVGQVGGGPAMAAKLTKLTGQAGGGPLFAGLQAADSDSRFERMQAAIVGLFGSNGIRLKSFNMGGFVPPGVTQPALLHGGAFGEDIVPRGPGGRSGAMSITFHVSALDASGFDRVFEQRILPALHRELRTNQRDTLTVLKQVHP